MEADTATAPDPAGAEEAKDCVVRFPLGLLGFEHVKEYLLVAHPDETPCFRLQMMDGPALSFVVVDPWLVVPEYRPDIAAEDARFLGLEESADAQLMAIVTLRGDGAATVNLRGPIVLNRHTLMARQVILANASEYSVQHPLPAAQVD